MLVIVQAIVSDGLHKKTKRFTQQSFSRKCNFFLKKKLSFFSFDLFAPIFRQNNAKLKLNFPFKNEITFGAQNFPIVVDIPLCNLMGKL